MSQTKRKTTSVSLTIGSSVKETSSSSVRQSSSTLIQPLSIDPKRVQSPPTSHSGATPGVAPAFTKCLQNISTSKGQLVVFECRIRATPPLQVHWYREHHPIIDSADFRILRKKACLSAVPEEVSTLVITEAYPEDSGVFKCIAENDYGCVASSAHLYVYPEFSDNDLLDDHQYAPVSEDNSQNTYYPQKNQKVISESNAADKPTFGGFRQMTKQDNVMSHSAFANDDLETIEGFEAVSDSSPEPETSSEWYSQLPERDYTSHQNISSAKQVGQDNSEDYSSGALSTSTAKDSSSTSTSQTRQGASCVSVTNLPSIPSVRPPSMFNYERPKYFIQAQPACPAQSSPQVTGTSTYVPKSPQNETHNFGEQPLPPSSSSINSPKYFSSSSFSSTMDSARQATSSAPQNSTSFTQGRKASYPYNQSPAAFLTSVLPSHQDSTNNNKTPVTMESRYFEPTYKKMPKQPQPTSDHQIQGTKDALIQDLERKLRCKDNLLQNGSQRRTYEERMARRLLGRENAASVFDLQNEDGMQDSENPDSPGMQGQGTLERSRHSSREETTNRSIQEKLFPPRFLTIPGDLEIEEGRFCRIDFKVSGLPAPDVTWYLNGRLVRNDDCHKMIVSEKGFHSFIFEVVRVSDAGEYVCTATNRAGKATFRMQLDVLAHERRRIPSFIHKPQSARAMEGDMVRIECQVSAVPFPQILLKKNNEMLHYNTDRIRLLQDSNGKICLLIYNVSKQDDGWYTISAVNEAGVATCHTRIDVGTRVKPTISNTKPLKVRPTFSKYSILNGRGLDDRADEDFQQTEPSYPGLYESEEL